MFGTSRRPDRVEPIEGAILLPLDVRSDESVEACVTGVLEEAGRLDVLVNNAGYVLSGPLEATTLDQTRDLFETDFFGAVRMAQAVLPTMRGQSAGRIVNVSSLAGVLAMPFIGAYSAAKFALEGWAEALAHEVSPFGIHVSLVEPGFVRTNMGQSALAAEREIEDYRPSLERYHAALERELAAADEPGLVASAIRDIVNAEHPALRNPVGLEAERLVDLALSAPEVARGEMRRRFGLVPPL